MFIQWQNQALLASSPATLTVRVTEHSHGLPREAVGSSALEILKSPLDWVEVAFPTKFMLERRMT